MIIMPHASLPDLQHLLWLLPMLYVKVPRTWVPGEMVTSNMMNTLRDLFIEVESGTADMAKTTLVGKTSAELISLVSVAGKAAIAYNKEYNALVASLNGSTFGTFFPILARHMQISGGTSTLRGSTPVPTGVPTTLFTLPVGDKVSLWQVVMGYPPDCFNYGAFGTIIVGATGSTRSLFNNPGTWGAMSLADLNVQGTQNSGGTITLEWSAFKIE